MNTEKPNALNYHKWLCDKLRTIINKDNAKAEAALAAGDLTLAKAHQKVAFDAIAALSYVESFDISSYNYTLHKETRVH